MEITIVTGLFAERDMDVDAGQRRILNFKCKFRVYVSRKGAKARRILPLAKAITCLPAGCGEKFFRLKDVTISLLLYKLFLYDSKITFNLNDIKTIR
jgi:hypothetical protein